jgi:hypothetical protein
VLSPFRESPVPRKIRRFTLSIPISQIVLPFSPSRTKKRARIDVSSIMYALRIYLESKLAVDCRCGSDQGQRFIQALVRRSVRADEVQPCPWSLELGAPQTCSNRAATRVNRPNSREKPSKAEFVYLQVFCKCQKALANYRTAFTRQRSLVRAQHRPPRNTCKWW